MKLSISSSVWIDITNSKSEGHQEHCTKLTTTSYIGKMIGGSYVVAFVFLLTTLDRIQAFAARPQPIDPSGWPEKFPAKDHCSKCGLCETTFVSHVTDACAFLNDGMARNIDGLEAKVHGRRRSQDLVCMEWRLSN